MSIKINPLKSKSISVRTGNPFCDKGRFTFSLSYSEQITLLPQQTKLFSIDLNIPRDYDIYFVLCPSLKSANWLQVEPYYLTFDFKMGIRNTSHTDNYVFEKKFCFAHIIVYKR
jgi:hypothetical protein